MRKVHVLFILAIVSVLYLLIQFFFAKDVSQHKRQLYEVPNKPKKPYDATDIISELESHPADINTAHVSYTDIKLFVKLSKDHGLHLFVVDPVILGQVMSSNTSHEDCKYLCHSKLVTSFGVLSTGWKSQGFRLEDFKASGFDVISLASNDPRSNVIDSLTHKEIPSHYMFSRSRTHVIHVVVFHERSNSYLWHAPIKWSLNEVMVVGRSKVKLSDLTFGINAGAYDKFEVVKVFMDHLQLYAPRYPLVFLHQVPYSRFIECNHSRADSFHSNYGISSDPEAFKFKSNARKLLAVAKEILDQLGIRFWLSSGTCLGWYRQCDIIPYSKDVDIGIWIKDYKSNMISAFEMNALQLKHLFGKVEDSFELSFQQGGLKLDVFFFYTESDYMWNGGTQAKTGNKYKYIFPKFDLCWTELLDLKVRVPCQTESYIQANYGKNWIVPVKEWDWKKSPPNVRENGRWSTKEWDKVIQLYEINKNE
ncbi:unnamed protein product [Owenia fusiformis]|uniref:Fukutin n=1 Tax=Owenia fusiformis TaxID=6347 RepID=A0A8S4N5J9_OWEFU|nr:unnamed protein product [Owenia fusiformis]